MGLLAAVKLDMSDFMSSTIWQMTLGMVEVQHFCTANTPATCMPLSYNRQLSC